MRYSSIGILIVVIFFFQSVAHPESLSFSDTINLVLQQSPELAAYKHALNIRDLEKQNAMSVFFPQLDLKTQHSLLYSRPDTTGDTGSSLNLQLQENLYDNHQSLTRYKIARLQHEIANLKYQNQRDLLCLELAKIYFQYSLAQQLAQVQQQQFVVIKKQYENLQNQFQQGLKPHRDYLRFKAELRRSEIDVLTANNDVKKYEFQLHQKIGIEQTGNYEKKVFTPIIINTKTLPSPPQQEAHIANHYRYRIAQLQIQQQESEIYLAKRAYWPEIFLTANAYHGYSGYLSTNKQFFDTESNGWGASIVFNFNLWDWGQRRRNIAISTERKMETEKTIANALNEFATENQTLLVNYQQAYANFKVTEELFDIENKTYSYLEQDYRNGKVAYLDLILGLRNLLNAKVRLFTTYFDLQSSLYTYKYYEGQLYDFLQTK